MRTANLCVAAGTGVPIAAPAPEFARGPRAMQPLLRAADAGAAQGGFELALACAVHAAVAGAGVGVLPSGAPSVSSPTFMSPALGAAAARLVRCFLRSGVEGRLALFVHALAPPPVPVPAFLVPSALGGRPCRPARALARHGALASEVIATPRWTPGRLLLCAAAGAALQLGGAAPAPIPLAEAVALLRALAASAALLALALAPLPLPTTTVTATAAVTRPAVPGRGGASAAEGTVATQELSLRLPSSRVLAGVQGAGVSPTAAEQAQSLGRSSAGGGGGNDFSHSALGVLLRVFAAAAVSAAPATSLREQPARLTAAAPAPASATASPPPVPLPLAAQVCLLLLRPLLALVGGCGAAATAVLGAAGGADAAALALVISRGAAVNSGAADAGDSVSGAWEGAVVARGAAAALLCACATALPESGVGDRDGDGGLPATQRAFFVWLACRFAGAGGLGGSGAAARVKLAGDALTLSSAALLELLLSRGRPAPPPAAARRSRAHAHSQTLLLAAIPGAPTSAAPPLVVAGPWLLRRLREGGAAFAPTVAAAVSAASAAAVVPSTASSPALVVALAGAFDDAAAEARAEADSMSAGASATASSGAGAGLAAALAAAEAQLAERARELDSRDALLSDRARELAERDAAIGERAVRWSRHARTLARARMLALTHTHALLFLPLSRSSSPALAAERDEFISRLSAHAAALAEQNEELRAVGEQLRAEGEQLREEARAASDEAGAAHARAQSAAAQAATPAVVVQEASAAATAAVAQELALELAAARGDAEAMRAEAAAARSGAARVRRALGRAREEAALSRDLIVLLALR